MHVPLQGSVFNTVVLMTFGYCWLNFASVSCEPSVGRAIFMAILLKDVF